jgi:large subunit ribosomal protein L21
MYAIMETGGKQYRVSPEEMVTVEKLPVQPGEEVVFDRVALVEQEGSVQVGTPWVEGAKVTGRVLRHVRGPKVEVFTYKSKENIKRRLGHRQAYTQVRVEEIVLAPRSGEPAAEAGSGAEEEDDGS